MTRKTSIRTCVWPFVFATILSAVCATPALAEELVTVTVDPTCSLSFNGVGAIQDGLFSFNAPPAEGIEKYYQKANIRHIRFMFVLAQLEHADWMVPEADLAIREDPKNPGRVDPAWWPKMSEAFRHSQALYVQTLLPMGQQGLAGHLKLDFLQPPQFLQRDPKRPFCWGGEDTARLIVGMVKAVEQNAPGAHVEAIGVSNEPNLLAAATTAYPGGTADPNAVKDYFDLLQPVADLVHKECPGVLVDAPIVAGGFFFYGAWENFLHWVKPALARSNIVDRIDIHGYMEREEWLPLELNGSAFRFRTSLGLLRNYEQIEGLTPRPVVIGEHNNWLGADPKKEDYYRNPIMQVYRAHFWLRDLLTYIDEPDKLRLLSHHYSYWKPPPPMPPEFPFNMFDPDTKKPFPSFDAYRVLADLRGQRVWVDHTAAETLRVVSSVQSRNNGKQLVLILFNDDDRPRNVQCMIRGITFARLKNPFCRRLLLQPTTGQIVYSEDANANLREPIHLDPYETRSFRWDIKGTIASSSSVDRREYYGDRILVIVKPGVPELFHIRVPIVNKTRCLHAEVGIELLDKKEKVDSVLLPVLSVDGNEYVMSEPRFVRFPQSLNYSTEIDANRLDIIKASLPVQVIEKAGTHAVEITLRRAQTGSYRIVFVRLVAEIEGQPTQ